MTNMTFIAIALLCKDTGQLLTGIIQEQKCQQYFATCLAPVYKKSPESADFNEQFYKCIKEREQK